MAKTPITEETPKTIELNSGVEVSLSLSSKSSFVLETMKKNISGKMEDIPYLPISNIYLLLDTFYPGYRIDEGELILTDEKYKTSWVGKETISTICKKQVTLTVTGREPLVYIASGKGSDGILSSDDARFGFEAKLTARALKVLCKQLGRVFRVFEPSEDDIVSLQDIIAAQKAETEENKKTKAVKENKPHLVATADELEKPVVTDPVTPVQVAPTPTETVVVPTPSTAPTPTPEVAPVEEKVPEVTDSLENIVQSQYANYLNENITETGETLTKEKLLELSKAFLVANGYKTGSAEHKAMIAYYNELVKTFVTE